MREAWWYMLIPAGTLTFLLLCLNLLADAINEATSPWVQRKR
jgi:ABC-type dipeptide/oligopeptide/nickel transport system permease subunit